MRRRTFLQRLAAGAVGSSAVVEAGFQRTRCAQGNREWRMATFFRPGAGNEQFARHIAEVSEGQLLIRSISGASEDPSKVIEDVGNGRIEMGAGPFLNFTKKVPAVDFQIMPFGLIAQEYYAWIEYGGGRGLIDRIYERVGCKYLPAGSTGMQMGGWFSREVNTIDDLKGLRIRMLGLPAAVMKALGAEPLEVAPWSEEAQRALHAGELDAFEYGGPTADLRNELYSKFKYYYYPDWQEPSVPFDLFINRASWDALPSRLQAIISAAATWLAYDSLINNTAKHGAALATLVEEHGVQVRQFPEAVLRALAEASDRVLRERASQDPLSQEVFDSIVRFREKASRWAMVSLQPFLTARSTL